MRVWQGCDQVPPGLPPTSVTIGTFDGVHRGHRALLGRVVADAAQGLLPVAVTFDPHPLAVIRPDIAPALLTTLPHRLELLSDVGLGGVLVLPFTRALSEESPERFATRVLAEALGARHVVVGRNFRFGHRATGDVVLLEELGRELGFTVEVASLEPLVPTAAPGEAWPHDPPSVVPGHGGDQAEDAPRAVSSTAIRALVAEGDVAGAARALGRPHRLSGPVVTGDRRGRDLGFPTANIAVPEGIAVPADGVYAGRLRTSAQPDLWWPAAVSIGSNPTFDGRRRQVEAHVLDAPQGFDVYGQHVDLDLVERIRSMLRFESVPALVAQMDDDVDRTRHLLG